MIAPDLLGHGDSAKPRGDYSLGAYASGAARPRRRPRPRPRHRRRALARRRRGDAVRLPVPRAHRAARARRQRRPRAARSACCSAPRRCRAPSSCCRCSDHAGCADAGRAGWPGRLGRVGLSAGPDLAEVVRGYASLGDPAARVGVPPHRCAGRRPGGQRVSAHDRLYLAADLPTLVVWGERDPIIPVAHGARGARRDAGQPARGVRGRRALPHLDDPVRFAVVLHDWLTDTTAADLAPETLRERLRTGAPPRAA